MSRVLLADDDKYLNKLLSDQLLSLGNEVVSVLDGETAWKHLEESGNFDVVVLDMLLPKLMGAEILARFETLKSSKIPRVIAISGIYKNPQEIQEITALYNISRYLTKPFHLEEFFAAIQDRSIDQNAGQITTGRLEDKPIEVLLLEAYTMAFTGKLLLKKADIERGIYFSNGFPVSAESTSVAESFGRSLVQSNVIDQNTLDEASRRMVEERIQFGQMLIKMRIISKDELFDCLRKHTHRLLLNAFLWRDGSFEFKRMAELPKHILPLEFNSMILTLKAHRALYSAEFLSSLYSTKLEAFCKCELKMGQILPLLNLDEESLKFFETLPGDKTLRDIISNIPEKNHEPLYRVLYLFESCQLISWSETPVINQTATVPKSDFSESFQNDKQSSGENSKNLQSEYMDLLNKDYFEIFGLSPDASSQDIDQAYRELRHRLHPDRFGPDITGQSKRILDDMLSRIDKAFQTINDETARQEYTVSQQKWKEDSLADSKKFLEAQDFFRTGLEFLNSAQFENAIRSFRAAEKIWDRGLEYKLYAIYSEFKLQTALEGKPSMERLQALKSEVQNHRSSDIGFLLLGHIYASMNEKELARESYQLAIKNNERNEEAGLALGRLNEVAFRKAEMAQTIKNTRRRMGPVAASILIASLAFALFNWREKWAFHEKGISELDVSVIQVSMPALSLRQKSNIAKIVLKGGWVADVPDPVLLSKCNEVMNAYQGAGIIELWLHEQEGKLIASCTKDHIRRYVK